MPARLMAARPGKWAAGERLLSLLVLRVAPVNVTGRGLARFGQHVPDHQARGAVHAIGGVLRSEPGVQENRHSGLDDVEAAWRDRRVRAEQRHCVGVCQQRCAQRAGERGEVSGPVTGARRNRDLAEDVLDQAVVEGGLAAELAGDGHRVHAQLRAEPAQAGQRAFTAAS
jgi:hypothetical protein